MWTKTTLAAAVASIALLGGSFNAVPVAVADHDAKAADTQKDLPQSEVFQGKIVNLHLYLTHADTPAYSDDEKQQPGAEKIVGPLAREVPIGIELKDAGLAKIVPGHTAYLVFFDRDSDASEEAYDDARDLMGHKVKLTGKLYDRGGLKGLLVEKVESMEVESAEIEKPAED